MAPTSRTPPDHPADIVRLVGRVAVGIADVSRRTQEAVTDHTYDVLTPIPGARGVRRVHTSITTMVYAGIGQGLTAAAALSRMVVRFTAVPRESQERVVAPRAHTVSSFLNGVAGHLLAADGSALAVVMAPRHDGRDLPITGTDLVTAYGRDRQRIAVFVHGLIENEAYWRLKARVHHGDPAISLGTRLERDLDYVPVYLRYNTGLRVSTNGALLCRLLDDLLAQWPDPVEDIVLIGHSMGGLVINSALAQAATREGEHAWPSRVHATITLGTPRDGAPLERLANGLTRSAARLPHTRWLADLLDVRSDGIHDLRHGNLVETDWRDHDRREPTDTRGGLPLFAGPRHLAIYGALTASTNRLAALFGDGLVPVPAPSPGPAGDLDVAILTGLHHQHLLNHPRVHEQVVTWLQDVQAETAVYGHG